MAIKDRKARAKHNLRQQILDAARDLFIAEGYDRVSMRRVAERIEYSPTTIYLHYKNKTDLLIAISERSLHGLLDTLESVSTQSGDPVETLREGAKKYAEFGLTNPQVYELVFIIRPHKQADLKLTEGAAGERAFQYLRGMVQNCVDGKQFRTVDVETTAQSLWASMHGLVALLISYPEFPWVNKEALIDSSINTMIDGLRA